MNKTISGKLLSGNGKSFILDKSGTSYFSGHPVWNGYLTHWEGSVCDGRLLPQKDYKTGRHILLLWPHEEKPGIPFIEIYYNERLVQYAISLLGHLAVNINGSVFNFSHAINENEILSEEEYFYRPPLGEFAPCPHSGGFNIDDPAHPYYDKFGRLFMRSIHVLRITGIDTEKLYTFFRQKQSEVHAAPVNRKYPDRYSDFSIFKNSCSTVIRDGLKHCGFSNIKGIFPRDLFTNIAYRFYRENAGSGAGLCYYIKKQLKVNETPYSMTSPLLNPLNYVRKSVLNDIYHETPC